MMDILKEYVWISQTLGKNPAYVQGGGGNTSAKLNDTEMAIKASGFRLDQITESEGYVPVNYKEIRRYFEGLQLDQAEDAEGEGTAFIKSQILQQKNPKGLRPSVETGFHSMLDRFVLHTHSVYANLICCAADGEKRMEILLENTAVHPIWVPYTHPGIRLTYSIRRRAAAYRERRGAAVNAIFMENHGLIVTGEDAVWCMNLHEQINRILREAFDLPADYIRVGLVKKGADLFAADCPYLSAFFKGSEKGLEHFAHPIYPDHIVYLDNVVSFDGGGRKVDINRRTGEILYHANRADAAACNETLAGYIFVTDTLIKRGIPIKTMAPGYVDLIKHWESEAYRRQLIRELQG